LAHKDSVPQGGAGVLVGRLPSLWQPNPALSCAAARQILREERAVAARKKKHPWRNAILTFAVLAPIAAVVVYSSFHVSQFACEVCISFQGRDQCRTVKAQTQEEALRGAIDNTCGILASGVTDTLRCQRTMPTTSKCRELGEDPSARPTLGVF
jgi:hypothetical protein